jgi:hypothetical protein
MGKANNLMSKDGEQKITGELTLSNPDTWRRLEINGGLVATGPSLRLALPPLALGYADAQLDDYGLPAVKRRRDYPWQPGVRLSLRARFSHEAGVLQGTAGFGFWNAPFGDPTVPWPALPQAVWFFYASTPSDLPLPLSGPGRGWFVATIDAARPAALALAPAAPLALLLHQLPPLRRRLWPFIRRRLGISFEPLTAVMTAWHHYELHWETAGSTFKVNGQTVFRTPHAPRGPLGFVAWLDNQYMVVTVNGRMRWGTLTTSETQWLELAGLKIVKTKN